MAGANPSRLEQLVLAHVRETFPELHVILRSRDIKKTRSGKSRYEMDIYLPELKLAFEVQDFATHSRTSDSELGHPWRRNGLKNGPKHHELKRRLALEQLNVILIDLWEDEILDGRFRDVVNEQVRSRFGRI